MTGVLSFAFTAASAKVRTGCPSDNAADYALPIWAGVVPYVTGYGAPVTDESGVRGVEVPGSVVGLLGSRWVWDGGGDAGAELSRPAPA